MKVPIKPIGHHIVVVPPLSVAQIINGIHMPTTESLKPYAEVVAVGTDVTTVKVGQEIVFRPSNQTEVTLDETRYVILAESDILAVMEDD
jgi:chaperonin GroES